MDDLYEINHNYTQVLHNNLLLFEKDSDTTTTKSSYTSKSGLKEECKKL